MLNVISFLFNLAETNFAHIQEKGSVIISMDALFGLPRKKSAGQSHRDPLHGHVFFKNQVSVDEHVASAPQRRVYDKVHYPFIHVYNIIMIVYIVL